ncbi:MAG: 2,3-bisphosphoglycerate-independent phosphoglycerate mutase [Candidatus Falkowbacteria bacterium]
MKTNKLVALIILDGWGIAPPNDGNAIALAKTPYFDQLISRYPTRTLLASGEAVGLSWGEMGNSEVGHLNLGTGRIFYQNLPRIDKAISDKSFFENPQFLGAIEHVKQTNGDLHLLGILSEGRVHGMLSHLYALLDLCKKEHFKKVYIHGFLDGRDTIYNSGADFVKELQEKIDEIKVGEIASLCGRFYAMDRDRHWERTEKAYRAIIEGKSEAYAKNAVSAIDASYHKKVFDEEFVPVVIGSAQKPVATIKNGDSVILFNYRSDRARQLAEALTNPKFDKFERVPMADIFVVSMTEYETPKGSPSGTNNNIHVAFPKEPVKTCLAKTLSENKIKQLHVAETEKYAHVTFFFNGGKEEPYPMESRIMIPSPRVSSYAEIPEMSAKKISDALEQEILKENINFIVVNYANPDMVGHTGDLKAVIKAVETTDKQLERVINLILSKKGIALIVADHGNAEEMINLQTGEIDKEHSTNPVPFIVIGEEFEGKLLETEEAIGRDLSLLRPSGILSDLAPTILKLLNIKRPKEMSGQDLL